MSPEQFIAKWRANARTERAACQEHFIDLCALLGEPTPNSDPDGATYAFEKGLTKAVGGDGWADVWRRGCARGHDPHAVAHFINRLVFCLFADDVGLLPAGLLADMLAGSRRNAARFAPFARELFPAMASQGGRIGFTPVPWFNGGLFDDDATLALEKEDIELLERVAELDWAEIDPSIMGTLFERGLDPDKRSQLGAHYTDRDKIEMPDRPGDPPPAAGRVGDSEGANRGAAGRGRSTAARANRSTEQRGGAAAAFVPRSAACFPGTRSGVRVGEFPLPRAARAERHRASGLGGGGGAGIAARVPASRTGMRAGDRDQRLRRRAGTGVGVDRAAPAAPAG
ncbi:MAG: type IIL restriction-modification enzyme MmeI [Acetobacteraceae bacterium]